MTVQFPTPEEARVEYHDLLAQQQAIMESAKPFREAYDAKREELARREKEELDPLIAEMREAEEGLFEINQQMGRIVRYLNGDTALPEHRNPPVEEKTVG